MNSKKGILVSASALILVGIVLGMIISSRLDLTSQAYAQRPAVSKASQDLLSRLATAMAEVTAAVKPAVVNISSTRIIRTSGMQSPFLNDPFFKQFFGNEFGHIEMPREQKSASLGSGVIVDARGYILTNYHVVKDAAEIKVTLSDKREFKGKVIGADSKTDLAVVKIGADHLPVAAIGDSDKLKVGETVIAIGNPFGLNQTVTSGIVSATGRANVGISDYEDFIQTDAAINPGNSGGALVNVKGELVGINTAIFSTSGGYQGIGFAIPSSMAKAVMENLIKGRKVVRGWLGLSIQSITPALAKQFKLKEDKGVLVSDVTEKSPAEKAGIRRGDVILQYDGKAVDEPSNLRIMVANTPPNKKIQLKVLRDGKPVVLAANIGEIPGSEGKLSQEMGNRFKGVLVSDITPAMRRDLNIPKRVPGVLVTGVEEGSPARGILEKNDIIEEINRRIIHEIKDFQGVMNSVNPDAPIMLLVYRNGYSIYMTLPS